MKRIAGLDDRRAQDTVAEFVRQSAITELTLSIEQNPKNDDLYLACAELCACALEWKEAAADLAKACELNPAGGSRFVRLGNMLLLSKDLAAYNQLCQRRMSELSKLPRDEMAVNSTVWLFCLAPGGASDFKDLLHAMECTVREAGQARRGRISS